MKSHGTIRWALALSLTLLIGAGFSLQLSNDSTVKAQASESQSISPSASNSPSASSSTSTSSPSPSASSTVISDPVLKVIRDHQKATGCHFNSAKTAALSVGTCKIMLVGDSIGNNLGYGMLGQLNTSGGLKFSLKAKASTGLSNSWFYNWPNNLSTFLKAEKPNLVIVLIGANDRQNMKVGTRVLTYPTTAWQSAYKAQVTKMTKLATDAGAYVLWVGMPISKPYNYNQGMKVINAQFRAVVPTMTGATFVPLWTLTADLAGVYRQYASVNGVRTKIRGDDGIHFTADGQSVIGTYIIDKVASVYHVTLRSTHRHELR